MKTAFMALCAVTMLAVTASCSSDKNEVDYPKTTEQVLNHMVGEYKGTLGFSTHDRNWYRRSFWTKKLVGR